MALRITIDMFSGRLNPSWEISDPDQVGYLEELLLRTPEARVEVHSAYTGLGFDGVRVEFTERPGREGLPQRFELAGAAAKDEAASAELAAKLVETSSRRAPPARPRGSPTRSGGSCGGSPTESPSAPTSTAITWRASG
ncbi:hypothetical protein ACFT0G_20445, partial [Streptomyces sp. NPDC057020]